MNKLRLYNSDCRHMAELPDESVQCCVTSPPYWGLRKYAGCPDLVWGGKADCEHVWGIERIIKRGHPGELSTLVGTQTATKSKEAGSQGSTCSLCGAWRGQLGLEPTVQMYVSHIIEVLEEVRRVLRPDGCAFVNLGDSYAHSAPGRNRNGTGGQIVRGEQYREKNNSGSAEMAKGFAEAGIKPKDLCLVPFRVALAAQEAGWWVRSVIIWSKPNPMPESVRGLHYIRHRVTIEEYETMQRVRSTESGVQQRTSDLQGLQTGEVSHRQETLPAESEGQGDGQGERGTRGCAGETSPVQPITAGAPQQGDVRGYAEGTSYTQEGDCQIQSERTGEDSRTRSIPTYEGRSEADSAEEGRESSLYEDREVPREEVQGLRSPEGCDSCDTASDTRGLAGHSESAQEPLSLLPQTQSADGGPRHSVEQGRSTRQGKHSASLPELQRNEEGQDDSTLVDCPGCPKCNHGYILIKGSGRPTESHEYVLMLTKSANYFYDSEAVAEKSAYPDDKRRPMGSEGAWQMDGRARGENGGGRPYEHDTSTRNLRSVWTFPTSPYKDAHFATFPEALPERCIKAATPEVGSCARCGAPWVRVVEKIGQTKRQAMYERGSSDYVQAAGDGLNYAGGHDLPERESKTLGWRPSCKCGTDEKVGAVVLDPFAGSGTTLWVARRMGREAVGYELSPDYCKLIEDRNRQGVL